MTELYEEGILEEDFAEEDDWGEGVAEDFVDDDEEMGALLEAIEDFDDDEAAEFIGPLLGAAAPALLGPLGGALGGMLGRSRGSRRVQARPRRMGGLPAIPGIGRGSFRASLRGFATKNELKRTAASLDRKILAVRSAQRTQARRIQTVNNRVNTTNRKLSTEVNKLRAADAAQNRGIRLNSRRSRRLRQDVDNVRQTSVMLSLLGGGEQEYDVTDIQYQTVLVPDVDSSGVPTGSFTPQQQLSGITLDPQGDSLSDLLPLVLLSGQGGSGSGGLDPLLLVLLLRD